MNCIINGNAIVKEHEFTHPENDEVDYLPDKVIEDCKKIHTFKYRCVYNFEFTNITNNVKDILNIGHDCLEFKPKDNGLNKIN